MYHYSIQNGLVYQNGRFKKTNIYILNDKIAKISDDFFESKNEYNAEGSLVLPGIIDPHVHFDLDCGKLHSVDDFYYGSKSAIYGGVTTVVDFLEPTRNADELEKSYYARLKDSKECNTNYHFHACMKNPDGNLEEYVLKMRELGMNTLKIFTTYSDTKRRTEEKDIIELLKLSEKYKFILLVHAENDDMIVINENFDYKDLPFSRPSEAETGEVLRLANYVKQYGGYLYIVHCSSGNTAKMINSQFKDLLNKKLFLESCPQYFIFNDTELKKENGNLFTFAPPLRSEKERLLLCKHIDDIMCIGTDHCAFNINDKQHLKLKSMPLGIGGIESSFSLMYHLFGDRIIDKMSKNVALIEGFSFKGEIKENYDADLFIFKKENTAIIQKPHGKTDYSIYEGLRSSGEVIATMIGGNFVYINKQFIKRPGKHIINMESLWLKQ